MRSLYLECYSGISGDMTVAALLDLGADEQGLRDALASLPVQGYHLHTGRVQKCGISAFDFDVHLEEHTHDHDHHDHHDHGHDHEHHHHHEHVHRGYADIVALIEASGLSPRAKTLAVEIFAIVAKAESKVHGVPVDEVHFHEVGAVDSIVDIVGAAWCLDNLGIERVYCSPLYEGTGTVRCQHGIMPVPAPATAEIIAGGGLSLHLTDNQGEMVTPTGAAIAAAVSADAPPAGFTIVKTGCGAGKKDFPRANILRAHLIEETDTATPGEVLELSCNLDDATGEQLGYAMEQLFEAGALDVWFTPAQMKKNRPAVVLSVLCHPQERERMTACLFTHTGTIGVRYSLRQRTVMRRAFETVQTPYGAVQMKHCSYGSIEKRTVEYDSARECARRACVSLETVRQAAIQTEKGKKE